jgi:glycosyltransferase involved in cell wall biosynthesis
LNISQGLSEKFNVINLLLGDGGIKESFLFQNSGVVLAPTLRSDPQLTKLLIERLSRHFKFKFAIVNSIESRAVLEDLCKNEIPTVTLIHEFSSYSRPVGSFGSALFWSNEVVFPANIVRENAFSNNPELGLRHNHVIPQGKCIVPDGKLDTAEFEYEAERIRGLVKPKNLDPDTKIILGVGFVQLRKGIDLFVECATRVLRSPGGENCRFIWIGKGYEPEHDTAYSVYINDQVERAGLRGHVVFIDETPAIEAAYREADLFLLSSRLDPLPNVAIEAMSHGIPVLCFNKTTGIADFLIDSGLQKFCVAQYIDTAEMAQKILALVNSQSLHQLVAKQCQATSIEYFDIENYVTHLQRLGTEAAKQVSQEKLDSKTILNSGLFQADFACPPFNIGASTEDVVRFYVRSWATGIERRKPRPGFHPGIYLEKHGVCISGSDPFADYIREGCPKGVWNCPVISFNTALDIKHLPSGDRVALHIHAYYLDLLPTIIDALSANQIRPDLFLTVCDEHAAKISQSILKNYAGKIIDIKIVPNQGRNIGPLLVHFGELMKQYDFIGHIHTKKTIDSKDAEMGKAWFKFLLSGLLGAADFPMADAILSKLNSDPKIGIVFPDDPNIVGWGKNIKFALPLAKRMGIQELPNDFWFPVGAMFWSKVDALKGLVDLDLKWDEYPPEPSPSDGSVMHALERLIGISGGNYGICTTHVSGMTR